MGKPSYRVLYRLVSYTMETEAAVQTDNNHNNHSTACPVIAIDTSVNQLQQSDDSLLLQDIFISCVLGLTLFFFLLFCFTA